jgi:hypothetical protein
LLLGNLAFAVSCLPPPVAPVVLTPPQPAPEIPEAPHLQRLFAKRIPILNRSTWAANRRRCTAVMVLPGAGSGQRNEDVLLALEGQLISRGIRVVSTGMTGRFASAPTGAQGAAPLSELERVMALAQRANVDCVFQVGKLEIGIHGAQRSFVWTGPDAPLRELRRGEAVYYPSQVWSLEGPVWEIGGKVIDVARGDVLAIVDLYQSTVWAPPNEELAVQATSRGLVPMPDGRWAWRMDRVEDLSGLRESMISLLAVVIAGPPDAPGGAPPKN